jgi:hypothetical protein
MEANRARYFRWNKRTARISFIYIVLVPAIFAYVGYKTDVRSCHFFGVSLSWRD